MGICACVLQSAMIRSTRRLLLASVLWCAALAHATTSSVPIRDYQEELASHLAALLAGTGQVARVYFQGTCDMSAERGPPTFPKIGMVTPTPGVSVLNSAGSIFGGVVNGATAVTQGSDGIVRVAIGNPPTALLETRLQTLTFDKYQQYSHALAIERVFYNNEIANAER